MYSADNLKVSITLIGSSSTLLNTDSVTLEMAITNYRGNLTVNRFTQLTPIPNPTDPLTNVLPLITGSTNQYLNATQRVDLNAATINNYVGGTSFRVKAEVENDCGDKAINYITLSKASKPTVGDATITCTSSPCKVLENMNILLTGDWYFGVVSNTDLWFKVEAKLSDGTIALLTSENWQQLEFDITLPVVTTISNSNLSVDLLITTTSLYDTSTVLTKSIVIDNTLSSAYRQSMYPISYDAYSDTDVALMTAQMSLTLKTPVNALYSENV